MEKPEVGSSFSYAPEVSPAPGRSPLVRFVLSFPSDWASWWASRTLTQKVLPVVLVALYWSTLSALKGFRSDHVTIGVLYLVLSYGGRQAQAFYRFILPVLLTGVLYDSMRFYSDYLRGPIHVTEPYQFDKTFFGITTSSGILTPNEWFQLHTVPILDFFTGLAYLVFIAVFVSTSGWIYFYLSKKGTSKTPAVEIAPRAARPMWTFFWVNMIGYSTYYWYAAAPPWYVAMYGLGPARMDVGPNQAGCVRFDQLMGTHFFSDFYGKSADVFGAVPSLHVAYPLITLLFAFKFGTFRVFAACFYALMCFSAVYLNHHYILDILWGSAYAVLTFLLVNAYGDRKLRASQGGI